MNLAFKSTVVISKAINVEFINELSQTNSNFSSPTEMEELLIAEGIEIIDDKIVNFDRVFWSPSKEIPID